MRASDEAMGKLCEVLAAEIGAGAEFEVELGELIGKYRRKHDRAMLDAEADRLLPSLGIAVAVERIGAHKSTIYRRVERARTRLRIVAANPPLATSG